MRLELSDEQATQLHSLLVAHVRPWNVPIRRQIEIAERIRAEREAHGEQLKIDVDA